MISSIYELLRDRIFQHQQITRCSRIAQQSALAFGVDEPDNDDDRVQKKSENVARAEDGIDSGNLRIRALAEFVTRTVD